MAVADLAGSPPDKPWRADVSYVPGELTAVAGDRCLALIDAPPGSAAVSRIWQLFGTAVAAHALLASLVDEELDRIPGFALLTADAAGQRRLFCRGTVGATVATGPQPGRQAAVETAAGEQAASRQLAALQRIDGAALLTWREELVGNAARIFLGVPPPDTALRLPAASGVLLASCVIVELAGVAAREAVDYPAGQPNRTVVFIPDTITITGPGSIQGQAALKPAAGPGIADRPGADAAASFGGAGSRAGTGNLNGGGHADGAGDDDQYDFLWGATMARSVADAAIDPAGGGPVPPGPPLPGGMPLPGPPPGTGTRPHARYRGFPPVPATAYTGSGTGPHGIPPGGPLPGPPPPGPTPPGPPLPPLAAPGSGMMPVPPGGATVPPSPVPAPGPPGGLIDAPAWLSAHGRAARAGGTGPAGSRPEKSLFAPPPPPGDLGYTVSRADLSALAAAAPPDRIGPTVPALICPAGHLNPPSEAVCRRCGATLPVDPVLVPRPVLGVLRLSLGDVITLDRDVVMGRSPRTDLGGADGEERPHIVKLPSTDGDISRTHLRVTLDGWHVLVTDLNSTNGTLVTLPGRDPEQLRPGEPVPIRPGTVVALAEGLDFRYEVSQ